jgi:serine protease Do
VRVRLTRIDNLDLNLFDFDYDLTFMVFFLNADEKVYARYGGRDAESPDGRQSLEGLRYTMQSVLQMHKTAEKAFAPKSQDSPKYLRALTIGMRRGCLHCHQVKVILDLQLQKKGQWSRERIWRYPLPDNLGFVLEVDRGNVIKEVRDQTPAAATGLRRGDVVQRLGDVPIHSFGDAQYALDRAAASGSLLVEWRRGNQTMKGDLGLSQGWRRTDITWRPSLQRLLPAARLYGVDLTTDEKKTLGLAPTQLAFRQKDSVPTQARQAGIRPGDIILGVDDKPFDNMDVIDFLRYVRRNYLIGDRVTVNILRDGKRLNLPMELTR